ncbi:hypothetical protein J3F84DRAFT_142221 [Trichoderma pleuroticola]
MKAQAPRPVANFREESPQTPRLDWTGLELPAKDPELTRNEPAIGYKLQGDGRGYEASGSACEHPSLRQAPNSGYQLPGTTSRRRAIRPGGGGPSRPCSRPVAVAGFCKVL